MQDMILKKEGGYGQMTKNNKNVLFDNQEEHRIYAAGSMDYPGKRREMAFGYNSWGALVKDESRRIAGITYDNFGNPLKVSYSDGSYTNNVYSATGSN